MIAETEKTEETEIEPEEVGARARGQARGLVGRPARNATNVVNMGTFRAGARIADVASRIQRRVTQKMREKEKGARQDEREAQNQGMWDQIPLGATATNTAFNPLHQIQLAVAGSGDRKSRRLYVGICCLHILSYFLIARFAFIYFTMLPFVIDFRDGLFC